MDEMMCTKILKFETRKQAKIKARQMYGKGGTDVRLVPYFCKECKKFHLTSKVSMNYKIVARSNK